MLEKDIERVLVTEEELAEAVKRLGEAITRDYQGKEVLVVGILRGASLFMADVIRQIDCYLEIDFMDVSSYGTATESSGEVKIIKDLDTSVEGKHVLIVEDIIDTGRTLQYLINLLKVRKAASIKICSLLDKPSRRIMTDVIVDYVGVKVPNEFVVGYGLDYEQKYRNLPYIGVLKESIYS
ncbi:hypoxanthine phosphoribosyltransferase [Facklamia hominis]|uniref:Hypoxanthine phosphoribosyltransferase n=2 Tax=Facklamia hominis TaxID=178214 RepID=K1LEB9_9LACT|nr:hypoxanthine phosphoribosyltransferase [Facklamia hominis]EKB54980.1 hypoxanthine phosphoribosyltransferase [Facklamia hominis CCUG 36813]MDK7187789.1 hypoxanthine phosphoribosyltransferase [Facklamia hominis]PKY93639.1 hypoxanthine phosphoribosyltransferase [Facklamia hominis]RYC98331.1 hypoxanthine phosphoribosyltransferase [Facklamia hominis]